MSGVSNTSSTRASSTSGRSMPLSARNRFSTTTGASCTSTLPASILARSSRSLTSSDRSMAALSMNGPGAPARRQVAVHAVQQQLGQRADRGQRRAQLVAGVRQEARLHFVGAAQALGLVLDLGVQGDDAAVGVFQFARQSQQVFLALAQLGQGRRPVRGSAAALRGRSWRPGCPWPAGRPARPAGAVHRRPAAAGTLHIVIVGAPSASCRRALVHQAVRGDHGVVRQSAAPACTPAADRAVPGTGAGRVAGRAAEQARGRRSASWQAPRATSDTAVAMRTWSCCEKPSSADTWRARWRTSTTSCSFEADVEDALAHHAALPARHQHHRVVAAADEVAHQHAAPPAPARAHAGRDRRPGPTGSGCRPNAGCTARPAGRAVNSCTLRMLWPTMPLCETSARRASPSWTTRRSRCRCRQSARAVPRSRCAPPTAPRRA
jgi:hypothetical protein